MPAFRHIVVGLDLHPETGRLTPGSVAALTQARWLATGESVRCTLVHSTAADEFWEPDQGYESRVEDAAPREALEAARAELAEDGIATALEVTDEKPWLAITRRVISGPADLVVVGKRTERDPGGPRLGSTAVKLLRKCPCAVWAMRPDAAVPPTRLLAATDLSMVGERVLQRAAQVSERAGAELHVVHAIQLTMAAQLEAGREAHIARARAAAADEIRAVLARVGCTAEPILHVALTTPTRAVLRCVDRHHPDLVVMATISRVGVPGLLLGNTAERLLPRLETSLLTVKPADFVCPVKPER